MRIKPVLSVSLVLLASFLDSSAIAAVEKRKDVASDTEQSVSLDDDQCGGGSNLENVQCMGKYIEQLNRELNRVYQRALAKMPEHDDSDIRKTREQLRKSQRAWLKFKDEDCTLIGGLEGGNNLWVTHFAAVCEEGRFRERIKFLRGISEGEEDH